MKGTTGRSGRTWLAVALVALLVVAAAVVVWTFVDRRRDDARLAQFEALGLVSLSVPELQPYRMEQVRPLDSDDVRGLTIGYNLDGQREPGLQVLQVNAGSDPADLCALLQAADPQFAEGSCRVSGREVSASSAPSSDPRVAEGYLYAQTLAVVVSDPEIFSAQELQGRIGVTRMMTVRELVDLLG